MALSISPHAPFPHPRSASVRIPCPDCHGHRSRRSSEPLLWLPPVGSDDRPKKMVVKQGGCPTKATSRAQNPHVSYACPSTPGFRYNAHRCTALNRQKRHQTLNSESSERCPLRKLLIMFDSWKCVCACTQILWFGATVKPFLLFVSTSRFLPKMHTNMQRKFPRHGN